MKEMNQFSSLQSSRASLSTMFMIKPMKPQSRTPRGHIQGGRYYIIKGSGFGPDNMQAIQVEPVCHALIFLMLTYILW